METPVIRKEKLVAISYLFVSEEKYKHGRRVKITSPKTRLVQFMLFVHVLSLTAFLLFKRSNNRAVIHVQDQQQQISLLRMIV